MTLSKEEIQDLIRLAGDKNAPNAITELDVTRIANGEFKSVKRFLLEMKIQIDRWDLITRCIYLNPDMLGFLVSSLKGEIETPNKWQARPYHSLWGIDFITDENIPPGTMLGIADLKDVDPDLTKDGRHIALGIFDYNLLERMNKIKAFW